MVTDFTRYVPLKQIVAEFLDQEDKSVGDFDKVWVLAFRGLVDMHYEISAEPKTLRLPVQANKTVTLPPDYLGWSKIGVLNSNGEVCTLKVNNALSTWKDNNPNRLSHLTPDVNNAIPALVGSPIYFNYYNNGWYDTYYGTQEGLIQFGECKIDEPNNVILLETGFGYDSIILEYISSPQKDSDYTIPITDQEAIIAFIMWKLKIVPPQVYYGELKKARRRKPGKKFTLQTINQTLRESNGMMLRG